MNIPKRHHFIPVLHLKHFTGPDPQGHVWTYEKVSGAVRSAVPENTAVESHFYSFEREDGEMDTRLETLLSQVESLATPTYEALLRDNIPLSEQARFDFAHFLALMYVRTPAVRRMSADIHSRGIQIAGYAYGIHDQAFETLIREVEAKEVKQFSEEDRRHIRQALLDPSSFVVEIPKELTLTVLKIASTLAPLLRDMTWTVLSALHGFFITTDNPLIRETDPKTHHPTMGDHGLFNKTAQVYFPLSRHKVLLLTWSKGAAARADVDRQHVDRVNRGLAAYSDRYLYAHIKHKGIIALAKEFRAMRPQMTTTGFGPAHFAETKVRRRKHRGGR